MSLDVYGVGNALVDIQAHVSDRLLTAIDYAKGIMTLVEEPTQREVLRKLQGTKVTRCAGGSAANTLSGVAQFGGGRATR